MADVPLGQLNVEQATQQVQEFIRSNPEAFYQVLSGPRPRLSQLFPGDQNRVLRDSLAKNGVLKRGQAELRMQTLPVDENDHEIVALGAISFDPGPTIDLIDLYQDFIADNTRDKVSEVAQNWRIYKTEGLVNNAVNKISAILSGGGSFKVRNAKQGRRPEPVNRLLRVLTAWHENVNSAAPSGVVTGARGLASVTRQGVRRALVEGDWIARHVWTNYEVLNEGVFKLPMNVQSISAANLEPVEGLAGTGAEAFYWKPPADVLQTINSPRDKNAGKILKQFLPKDYISELRRNQKVFLDPMLMLHVRHRGVDTDVWGESFITPALQSIAYKRAIDQLDFQTMQNLINRLTIVMVGSSDPNSPYSKADVAAARQALMASFFEEPGPNMTIVWAGDDIKIENVGAENVLALDKRHAIGVGKIKESVGVPDALLSGTSEGSKASGMAAGWGSAAQLEELQNSFAQVYTQLGARIAEENGFTEVDLVYEFDNALFVDRMEEWQQNRADYVAGVTSIQDFLLARKKNPTAVFVQKCFEKGLDPAATTWEKAFMPPQGMAGQAQDGPPALNGPGQGRQPDGDTGRSKGRERPPSNKSTEQS